MIAVCLHPGCPHKRLYTGRLLSNRNLYPIALETGNQGPVSQPGQVPQELLLGHRHLLNSHRTHSVINYTDAQPWLGPGLALGSTDKPMQRTTTVTGVCWSQTALEADSSSCKQLTVSPTTREAMKPSLCLMSVVLDSISAHIWNSQRLAGSGSCPLYERFLLCFVLFKEKNYIILHCSGECSFNNVPTGKKACL